MPPLHPTLRNLSGLLPFGSLNRRICGFAFGYAQIPAAVGTSHIPRTLSEIAGDGLRGERK